jgi:hypothetical protein
MGRMRALLLFVRCFNQQARHQYRARPFQITLMRHARPQLQDMSASQLFDIEKVRCAARSDIGCLVAPLHITAHRVHLRVPHLVGG